MKISARKFRYCLLFCLSLLLFVSFFPLIFPKTTVCAQAVTPTQTTIGSQWVFDPEVTELGKNSDRARQFLWWVFSHPGIHSAPVLVQLWAFSRNIIYIFIVLVIIAFGFSFILLRKKASAVSIPPLLVKIGAILLYVTFSYILILALIQTSEVIMRFFIETIGGKDLFNIFFGTNENIEANYTSFIGYRNADPLNQEMVHTSILLIRLTSLTYYALSLILILRTIILWFLLIISPFLAILLPFVFIRNTGFIWIGVFFQWLFYGPLLAIFLWGTTMIWKTGIPYPFDFSRAGQPKGQIYKTAINLLYGGPAQLLSAGNSANYIDTYAEYVISLVMLWAAIILPWLLLRIFRDYCCAAITASNATLTAIFDRIRQYPPPAPSQPTLPTTTAGMAAELPFRKRVEEKVKEVERVRIEDIKEISRVDTREIARAMNLSVASLADISRLELNQTKQQEVKTQLNKLASPATAPSISERERYSNVRTELQQRAASGDRTAQTLLYASEKDRQVLADHAALLSTVRPSITTPVKAPGVYTPKIPTALPTKVVQPAPPVSIEDYEEVKTMWLNHYRGAPIPISETIKDRKTWLADEEKKLTNIYNLLGSSDPKLKQRGFEQVAEILPFMLLGGFSDVETLAYIKAKIEAAKQIKDEVEAEERTKKDVEKKIKEEEEETLIETPVKAQAEKQAKLSAESEMVTPDKGENNSSTNKPPTE